MDGEGRDRVPSTEKMLAAWRAASRELDHAKEALTAAESAHEAARKAEQAARDTADAARTALDAAALAEASARGTAEAAHVTSRQTDTDLASARATFDAATTAEDVARERHHDVQDAAYERHGLGPGADPEPEADATGAA